MANKQKFYVVWNGIQPGVYDNWNECKKQVSGFPDAKYKSYESLDEANTAYQKGPIGVRLATAKKKVSNENVGTFIKQSMAVDAACSGNPGDMEYRGVSVETGKEWFHIGPYPQGTNNIGEFLALVHGLALLKQTNSTLPIYSDSVTALAWVRDKKCKTNLEQTRVNAPIFDLVNRAELWLKSNSYNTKILKWDTDHWGEIPADFGRKH